MEKKEIKLLALDLDGTLTNSQKEISAENKKAIREAIEKGVSVVLASGRPTLGIRRLAEELELSRLGGFILAYNGGEILNCRTGELVYKKSIPMEIVPELCALAREKELHLISYTPTEILSERPDGVYVQEESFCCKTPVTGVERLEEAFETEPVKFIAADEPEILKAQQPFFRERFEGRLNVFFSEPYFMEITPQNIEKSYGLRKLTEYLGIGREQVMACGDGFNDIPMMEFAGLSVAMENAQPEVKERADAVTASNDEDGVAKAVRKYILGKDEEL